MGKVIKMIMLPLWISGLLSLGLVHLAQRQDADYALGRLWAGRELTFQEAIALAEELDRISDSLPMPPIERSEEMMNALMIEVAGQFYYEGIVEQTSFASVFWYLERGERNFHVAGTYRWGLTEPIITLNIRYANPWASRWYYDPNLFAVLVHEVGHSQGVVGYDELMEPANQLATLEVLAGMTRERNAWALPAFVGQLEDFALDYAYSSALKENKMTEFRAFMYRRADNEYERASFERSLDHWKKDIGALKTILEKYGEMPLILTVEALGDEHLTSRTLDSIPNACHCVQLNDTAWVLRHLEALIEDYPALLASYGQDLGGE